MSNLQLPAESGIYTLIIRLTQPIKLQVGKLGLRYFCQGLYTYTGSAIGGSMNLRSRVSRHLASEKKNHWHIDYLLGLNCASIKVVVFMETRMKQECQISKAIEQTANINILVRGFGSSDCQNSCRAHLQYLPDLSLDEILSSVVKIYEQVFSSPNVHILWVNP